MSALGFALALALQGQALPELTPERCRAVAETVAPILSLGRQMIAMLKAAGKPTDGLQEKVDSDQRLIDTIVRRHRSTRATPETMAEAQAMSAEMLNTMLVACAKDGK